MDAEQRARELLADEYAKAGVFGGVNTVLSDIDRAAVAAITRALTQAQPGWRVVPVEPTEAMMEAGGSVEDLYRRGTPETWAKVYAAMLAAAPAPQQGEG
ncbi:MAG TPA: hypothetical protein VIN36_02975 [Thiobacillus sp.]